MYLCREERIFNLVPKLRFGNALPQNSVSPTTAHMTRSRYFIYDADAPLFLTCALMGRFPFFTRPEVEMGNRVSRHCVPKPEFGNEKNPTPERRHKWKTIQ